MGEWRQFLLGKEYDYYRSNGERLLKDNLLGEARLELEKALDALKRFRSQEEQSLEEMLDKISTDLASQNLDKARFYKKEGDLERALDYFQNALGIANSSLKDEVLVEIAQVKLEMDPVEEILQLKKEVDQSPQEVEKRFSLAMEYAISGYFDSAISVLNEVLIADPENQECLLRLGNACSDCGRFMEAVEYYQRGIEVGGDLINQVYYRLGMIYLDSREYGKAEENFHSCLKGDQGHLDAVLAMGSLFEKKGEREAAIDWYEKALALDADDIKTYLRIADLWAEGGYVKNAREIWKDVCEKDGVSDWELEQAREKLGFYELNY
jgi:tetratricopeptide (TPR) repeat protein